MARQRPTELSPLAHQLWHQTGARLQRAGSLLVALSGGLDSTVLLALLRELRDAGLLNPPLEAIHVHHGLQSAADTFEAHCRELCTAWQVSLRLCRVEVSRDSGLGIEAAARKARYDAFTRELPAGGLLLQAHHGDDQSETVFLHLLRGSGPRGLAGIPAERPLGEGSLLRPLLPWPRETLQAWAQEQGLRWVEDPSNADTRLDRNYLRQCILPPLKARWPALGAALERSSALQGEAAVLLDDLAALDLETAGGSVPRRLSVAALLALPVARRHNLLRYWIRLYHGETAGIPAAVLCEGLRSLLEAGEDRMPLVSWDSGAGRLELRRHQGELYLLEACREFALTPIDWVPTQALQLPGNLGQLLLETHGAVVPEDLRLEVRWRSGGERLRLARGTRSLKNLLQEQQVAPWLRARIPLVYGAGELLVVPGFFESAAWPTCCGMETAQIVWREADLR